MSELLAALPRLFSFRHQNDYAALVRNADAGAIAYRAFEKTARQMAHAVQTTVRVDQEENDTRGPTS